eukprot:2071567-Prymnesium_polylepis.1
MSSRPIRRPPPRNNGPLVFGLVTFTAVMCAVPLLLQRRQKHLMNGGSLYSSSEPLTAGQIRRGTYVNAGSKDAGPDPDWDHKTGLYKGKPPNIMDAEDSSTWVRK